MTEKFFNNESLGDELVVSGERAPVAAPFHRETREPGSNPVAEFSAARLPEAAPPVGGLSHAAREHEPVEPRKLFELSSFAVPTRWLEARSESDRAALEQDFRHEISMALGPFVEQLSLGAALVVQYAVIPGAGGAVALEASFRIEGTGTDAACGALDDEIKTCLGALSEHYTFRADRFADKAPQNERDQTWVVRPLALELCSPAGGIGFTVSHAEGNNSGLRLPAMDFSRAAPGRDRSGCWPTWPAALLNALKAARAGDRPFRIRIRIRRERLAETAVALLKRATASDLVRRTAVTNPDIPDGVVAAPCSTAMIDSLISGWGSVAADAIRVELEADVCGRQPNASLLRMLAAEIFPGRFIEIVPAVQATASGTRDCDLSNLYPLAAGMPPLLPHPTLLEALDFPRHHDNPSIVMAAEGLRLGTMSMNGFEHPVKISEADRSSHTYLLGATGSGKSTLVYNMICQDIVAGRGAALSDPHGDLFEQVLAAVPENRVRDVVIIDPSDPELPVGLNPLDFGPSPNAMQSNRIANDLLDIFDSLYDMRVSGGPGFEMFFRNILTLAGTAPHDLSAYGLQKGPPTLLTAVEIMRNGELRERLLRACKTSFLGADLGGEVVGFFESSQKQRGEQSFENWVPYVSSKLTRFLSNPLLRRLLCTPKRTIDFRQVLDERKILLINLNKGAIGDQDTRMLGMLLTKFIFQAALSRSDVPRAERTPYHYYLDEFQNAVTPDIASALAESRKYGLHLCLAHQTMSQLADGPGSNLMMMRAILGNCANKLIFRVGVADALLLEPSFRPRFNADTMSEMPDRKVLARILVNNKPTLPFVFQTMPALAFESGEHVTSTVLAARAWSRNAYSPDAAGCSGDAVSASAENHGVEPPDVARPMEMLNGLVAITSAEKAATQEIRSVVESANRALSRWQSQHHSLPLPTAKPDAGHFYWTTNRSLVLVCSVDEGGDGRGVVVTGGHGESDLKGECPAQNVDFFCDGRCNVVPLGRLLGMDLAEAADIQFEEGNSFEVDVDQTGAWLFSGDRLVEGVSAGFYETFNRSLVLAAGTGGGAGSSRTVIVCRGGHGLGRLSGEKPFERYSVSLQGQFGMSLDAARDISKISLGFASGMSLARRLYLKGKDAPKALCRPSARARRTRSVVSNVG